MIEKRISLKIETGDARKQLEDIKKLLADMDKNMPKPTDKPFEPLTKGPKAARKALIDYTGSLSNSNRIVIQSSNYATLAEKASLAQDTALRKLNKAYDEGRIDVVAYNSAIADTKSRYMDSVSQLNAVTTATGKSAAGFKVMRGGLSQMSYQLQDIAVQAQMGTNWFTIIGQQGPQIASIFGPLGAVLGIVVAVGAALGGVLWKSLNLATDGTKELEKAMSDLSEVMDKNEDGTYRLSDSFYDLGKASKNAQTLQLALSQFKSVDALDSLSRSIRKNTNSISSSLFGMFDDIDIDDYEKAVKKISSASNDQLLAAENWVPTTKYVNDGLKELSIAMREVEVTQLALGKSFGLTAEQSEKLVKSVSAATTEKTNKSYNELDDVLYSIFRTIKDGDDRKSFIKYAESMQVATEAGRKLNAQIKALKDGPFGDLQVYVDNTQLSSASLNSEFNETSGLLVKIAGEQRRLNDLVKAGAVNNITAQSYLNSNVLSIIADSVSGYETMEKRKKAINDLSYMGVILSEDELTLINQKAQSQNFLYTSQIDLLTQIGEIIDESADKTANAASETKAWMKLAGQLGEVYDQGAKDYAKSVGTYNSSLQSLVTNTFKSMENAIVSWAETGKLNFTSFVNSAISDLFRLIVQQQLAGIATAFSGGDTKPPEPSSNPQTALSLLGSMPKTLAKGGAWGSSGEISRYANGGVTGMVNTVQTTPKYFANGSGLLGEAGAEAIMPLTRTSGGDLGVKMTGASNLNVNVMIEDQTGGAVQYEQGPTTQSADGTVTTSLVAKLVNQTIASGKADAAMKNRFGIRRRGV